MGWPRAEIEEAFTAYVAAGAEAGRSGDWSKWPDIFTEDCEYIEHMYGVFTGRDAVREWITKTMGEYPGNLMHEFPINWYMIDEETGRVVCVSLVPHRNALMRNPQRRASEKIFGQCSKRVAL